MGHREKKTTKLLKFFEMDNMRKNQSIEEKSLFRTPEVPKMPKLRRSKSLAPVGKRRSSESIPNSFSSSFTELTDSFNESSLTSGNTSRESLNEIDQLTSEFNDLNSSFDQNTREKRKENELRFNQAVSQNLALHQRISSILAKPNQNKKTVLTVFQQLLDDSIED